MAHLAVETLLAQTAREVAAANDNNETDDTLRKFGKCAVSSRQVLYQDRPLNTIKFNFMDFQVLQMAYLRWKRKYSELSYRLGLQFSPESLRKEINSTDQR